MKSVKLGGASMSKYESAYGYTQEKPPLVPGETVLLSLKPKKNAFILNKVLTMMPIALIWLAFDSVFIASAFSTPAGAVKLFTVVFMLMHLMPVWIWLGNVITANRRWKNTMYYVTDRRIIIQSGFVDRQLQTIYYKEIRDVNLRIGLLDKLLGVGDVHFDMGHIDRKGRALTQAFLDVENPRQAYTRIQKIVMDMQTDIEFPNAYRPESNPGYSTNYEG